LNTTAIMYTTKCGQVPCCGQLTTDMVR